MSVWPWVACALVCSGYTARTVRHWRHERALTEQTRTDEQTKTETPQQRIADGYGRTEETNSAST